MQPGDEKRSPGARGRSVGALPALRVEGLCVYYGRSAAVQDVAFDVASGETIALLGRNGAGKTSTLLGIAGVVRATAGSLEVSGVGLRDVPAYKRTRAGLALVPSGSRGFTELTVRENLAVVYSERRLAATWSLADLYDLFPKLRSLESSLAGQLSGGERQMLAIARALRANPTVLMLDEPSEGLAPRIVRELAGTLRRLNAEGVAVVLTEQSYKIALETASRAMFMEKGQIVWRGSAHEAGTAAVIHRYLGV